MTGPPTVPDRDLNPGPLSFEASSLLTELFMEFPVFLAKKIQVISRFCPGQKAILQVILRTIFAPKGRCQRCSKITGVQNLEKKILSVILKCCIF